jgi:hypothetical protein
MTAHRENIAETVWVTGIFWLGALTVLVFIGYLVFASKPGADPALGILFAGIMGSMAWPIVVSAGLIAGLVFGLRSVVHGRALEFARSRRSRVSRRDLKIAELERMNALLEQELGITGEANG